jgi:hypothetical protein
LRNGRILHKIPTGTPQTPLANPTSIGVGPVLTIVVKRDGSAAWIARDNALSTPTAADYQVDTVDNSGGHLVASGANIDPSSLALAHSIIYWTEDGKPMSAALN